MRSRVISQLVAVVLALSTGSNALWPKPTQMTNGTTPLRLSPTFSISSFSGAPADVSSAISRTEGYLKSDNLGRLVPGRGASDQASVSRAHELTSLKLELISSPSPSTSKAKSQIVSITDEAQKPVGERDEGYTLTISASGGTATLSANSTLGLFRGLTTFSQLWYTFESTTYLLEAPVEITDSPAFPFRGFMLDTARNFFPVADIKRTLDAMSLVKLNTFHWHVTDSQSFPLQIPGFTELSATAAYSNASIYTAQDVQDIVTYAGERGIDVLMEIDTPGHSSAIGVSHPEHVACFVSASWSTYAAEPPSGQLRIASAATTNFTADLFTAAAKMMPGNLFSTGGDEVNAPCYADDPETQASLNATGKNISQALDSFVTTMHSALRAQGKTPVVWEEMVLSENITLAADTVVIVWISSEDAAAIVDKGYRLVHGPSDFFYLDCGAGEWIGDDVEGNSWCDPFKAWQKAYSFDPFANLTDAQKPLVLGGEQLLWTEQSGPENLDSIAWPRAAASAELFWTGGTLADGSLDVSEALARMHDVRYRLKARGVNAINLQPEWCALRPEKCLLNS